jgi:hypothetical protein
MKLRMASSLIFLATTAWTRHLQSAKARRSVRHDAAVAIHIRLMPSQCPSISRSPLPRRDMVLVAAAGPAINIALAVAAALALPLDWVLWRFDD